MAKNRRQEDVLNIEVGGSEDEIVRVEVTRWGACVHVSDWCSRLFLQISKPFGRYQIMPPTGLGVRSEISKKITLDRMFISTPSDMSGKP